MFGVPENLDLTVFHQAELIQVCLGQHQVQLHFHPAGDISIEGSWELLDGSGRCIDRNYDTPDRPAFQLHRLLGRKVIESEVSAPTWMSLKFDGGDVLRVFDDSECYESFQIQPGDVIV